EAVRVWRGAPRGRDLAQARGAGVVGSREARPRVGLARTDPHDGQRRTAADTPAPHPWAPGSAGSPATPCRARTSRRRARAAHAPVSAARDPGAGSVAMEQGPRDAGLRYPDPRGARSDAPAIPGGVRSQLAGDVAAAQRPTPRGDLRIGSRG